MRTSAAHQVRALLRANPDGMTVRSINAVLHRDDKNMLTVLRNMPDTYIDRWEPQSRKAYAAVWCVVVPPDDCPRPNT